MSEVASMTGFAGVDVVLEGGQGLSVTVKSVNHRHLDLQLRLSGGLEGLEPELRRRVKARVKRGHVEVTVSLGRSNTRGTVQVDEELLGAYMAAHRQAAERFGVVAEVDMGRLLSMPGVMSMAGTQTVDDVTSGETLAAVELGLERLNEVRRVEGATLAEELMAAMGRVRAMTDQARQLREGCGPLQVARLRERLVELLEGAAPVSEERLAAEAAVLVARGDVEEELVRLRTHTERFVQLLEEGGEVGRPLDFLLQELNRETNTMLSKTGGGAGEAGLRLTELGLAMKVEWERAREQVQNLE